MAEGQEPDAPHRLPGQQLQDRLCPLGRDPHAARRCGIDDGRGRHQGAGAQPGEGQRGPEQARREQRHLPPRRQLGHHAGQRLRLHDHPAALDHPGCQRLRAARRRGRRRGRHAAQRELHSLRRVDRERHHRSGQRRHRGGLVAAQQHRALRLHRQRGGDGLRRCAHRAGHRLGDLRVDEPAPRARLRRPVQPEVPRRSLHRPAALRDGHGERGPRGRRGGRHRPARRGDLRRSRHLERRGAHRLRRGGPRHRGRRRAGDQGRRADVRRRGAGQRAGAREWDGLRAARRLLHAQEALPGARDAHRQRRAEDDRQAPSGGRRRLSALLLR